ncbi:glycosyl transferase family 25 [Altererythrobacter atlanticus]|nr:glycosyl transferase family 25 [Croceibacterium atlanticum]
MFAELPDCDWKFFDVVPADELSVRYDEEAAFRSYGSILSAAERSCAASHIAMLETWLADGRTQYLVVMEDDLLIDPNFSIGPMINFMDLCQVHYLKLYARFFVPAHFIANIGRQLFYRASWPALGTQCYIVSREGALQLTGHIRETGLLASIDMTFDRFWETGVPVTLAYPFPLLEMANGSSIHTSRATIHQRNRELREKIGERTQWQRLREKLARHRADRAMRQFDAALRQRIAVHQNALYDPLNAI